MDCLFCSFASRKLPADILFENEGAFAILDIHPSVPGHTLLIPKKHTETILDFSSESFAFMLLLAQRVVGALSLVLKAEGFTVGFNLGKAAHQGIPHLHMHVIPRFSSDAGGSLHTIVRAPSERPLLELAAEIRKAL